LPTLPPNVAACIGYPLSSWFIQVVTLTNEDGEELPKGICHNADAHLVIDMDRIQPLGDNCTAI